MKHPVTSGDYDSIEEYYQCEWQSFKYLFDTEAISYDELKLITRAYNTPALFEQSDWAIAKRLASEFVPVADDDYDMYYDELMDCYDEAFRILIDAYEDKRIDYIGIYYIVRGWSNEFNDYLDAIYTSDPTCHFMKWKTIHRLLDLPFADDPDYKRAKAQYESFT